MKGVTIYSLNAFVSKEAAEPEVTETGRVRRKAASRLVRTRVVSKLISSKFFVKSASGKRSGGKNPSLQGKVIQHRGVRLSPTPGKVMEG